ncbi:hypothetical protein KKF38_04595 [Patescibacteria group bacterium]|nr:hypothetical protein [Patescibacteria group bacterium]
MKKSFFSTAKVKAARKRFEEEKVCGKTVRVKAVELEPLLLYGVSQTRN